MRKQTGGQALVSQLKYFGILLGFFVFLCLFFQVMTGRAANPDGGLLGWLTSGTFLTLRNFDNLSHQIAVNAILGVGMTIVIISAGIDLSVGSVLALAGVLSTAIIMRGFPPPVPYPPTTDLAPVWPLVASVPVAALVAALVGGICGLHNALPIVKLRVPPFIATLAMYLLARGFALIYVSGGQVGNLPATFTGAIGSGWTMPVVALLTVVAGSLMMSFTSFGRAVYAVGGNEKAARLSGIDVARVKLWVYVICGMLAGIAGMLLAGRIGAGDPKTGQGYELNAIAAVVLGGTSLMGGVGTVPGTMLGAVIIGSLDTGMGLMGISSFVQMVVKGYVILMAVVLDQVKKRG